MSSRRVVIAAAFSGLLLHAVLIAYFRESMPGPLLTDVLELLMGIGTAAAAAAAAKRSERYARQVWALAAVGLALYATGQGLVTYYRHLLHAPIQSPWFSSQFLFFWVVPFTLAVLIRSDNKGRGFDWLLALDFGQVFMVALALHLSVFAMSANWQFHGTELEFLQWRIRMFRDAVVLTALVAKVIFSQGKTRSLFLRFTYFFSTYAVVSAIYLYEQATRNYSFGWLDLLWTVPRVIMICVAATWIDRHYTAEEANRRAMQRSRTTPLYFASTLGPLMVAMIALPITPNAPAMAGSLILASFAFSGFRLWMTQHLQERASEALRSNRHLLEAVVEGTTEVIYIRDLQGKYLLANRAARRLLGSEDLDVIGRTNDEFFSPLSAMAAREHDLEIIRSNMDADLEQTVDIGGRQHIMLARKSPYRDAAGNPIGVLGIAMDVTERRKMEEELRRSQRMESIGTLAAGVAHDFNNLITVIKGYSQLVMEDPSAPSARPQLQEIDAAANKAESLTRQLLAFSRQQVMQPRITNLNVIMNGIEKMLRRLIGSDIDFKVLPASTLQSVRVDPGQIEQLIMNLAANARDAMPQGGKLTIATTNTRFEADSDRDGFSAPPGPYVMLSVSDTGMGMDETTQARMFEPFFTTKPTGKGTGLGLSTVYGIAKQSSGYIKVQSAPGKGTTFQIFFPAVGQPAEPHPVVQQPQQSSRGSETVLVVEDEPKIADVVATTLTRRGYHVLIANNGKDAEDFAASHPGPIHIMLIDVVMPKPSGREIADRITALRPDIFVVWMSGYTDDTIVRHGILEPGLNFLQKPFTPAALVQKIREVCDSKPV